MSDTGFSFFKTLLLTQSRLSLDFNFAKIQARNQDFFRAGEFS